jgi:AAA+ superfamily predicted ATPase
VKEDIKKCNEEYFASIFQDEHCSISSELVGWGCRFLTSISLDLPKTSYNLGGKNRYWFQFGFFENETIWKIDKSKIKEILLREVEQACLESCSVFKKDEVLQKIETLPEEIDLNDSVSWAVEYKEEVQGDAIELVPVSILPKKLSQEYHHTNTHPEYIKDDGTRKPHRNIPEVSFKDIGGIEDIIGSIREIIELPLKQPDLMKYMGIKPHKGILLYGPPGCGKTLIARAIANEIEAHFISVNGPELINKYYGQSEANLRDLFEEARDFSPSIIFFDEFDSIGQNRSGEENLRFDSRIVNQLLTLMDGIEDYGNLCVIASTNRPELIDSALLRPGRFDYQLQVNKPTRQGCHQIFSIQIREMPVDQTFDVEKFCHDLEGLSGADIAYVAREGAYNCLRRSIDLNDLIEKDDVEVDKDRLVVCEIDFQRAFHSLKK